MIEAYHNDARMNGLHLDRHSEERAVELFASNIVEAGQTFLDNPMETPFIPNWSRVQAADPDLMRDLHEAVKADEAEFGLKPGHAKPLSRRSDWWKSMTVYQIYPRSFCDSDGDGIGDIPGIVSKLDYLADLGIGVIWLSPVYASPMEDNGYDISDYRAIAPEFGTLADMDRLIAEAGKRGIGIVMDLVVNHTSDRTRMVRGGAPSRDNPKARLLCLARSGSRWRPAQRLASYFGGSAWAFDEATGQYYLHLFAPGQPDLNWENPAMRAEIYDMMNWWLDRGIAGFRMDVIDLIGKEPDREILNNGPRLHDHLQRNAPRDARRPQRSDRRRDLGGDAGDGRAVFRPRPRRTVHGLPVPARHQPLWAKHTANGNRNPSIFPSSSVP
jgi:hypothetical protein